MTARSFADTNIVVYTLDVDRKKQQKAISLMRATPVISVQVVNEFVSVALGKMKLPRPTTTRLVNILIKRCEVLDLTIEMVRHAISLGERYQLSHWDALIVASALQADCDILYSEDLHNGQIFEDRLKVINPFMP